jgi:acetoin utilization deacetylase AcuC-like enzyme
MPQTPIFYSPRQVADHAFISIQKLPAFMAGAKRPALEPTPFTPAEFNLAHKASYVQAVLDLKADNGFGTRSASINQALAYSNASLWAAAEHVLECGGIACSASQGFHHASYDSNFGYCTFNGLVIAARKALASGVQKVLIIDGDAHYGDGTDSCIQALRLTRKVINITRDQGIGTAQAGLDATQWAHYTEELLQRHRPGLVLYQAGADAWIGDPYGCGYLSFDQMGWRDQGVFAACMKYQTPIAWNLAGGYTDPMDMTVAVHLQTLAASDQALNTAHMPRNAESTFPP